MQHNESGTRRQPLKSTEPNLIPPEEGTETTAKVGRIIPTQDRANSSENPPRKTEPAMVRVENPSVSNPCQPPTASCKNSSVCEHQTPRSNGGKRSLHVMGSSAPTVVTLIILLLITLNPVLWVELVGIQLIAQLLVVLVTRLRGR